MNFNLQNKTVLVTAASSGIGRAIAELFLQEDCKVVICSSSKEKLEKTSNEINEKYSKDIFYTKCDINNLEEIELTVKYVESKFENIDILVNNCGGPTPGYFDDLDDET